MPSQISGRGFEAEPHGIPRGGMVSREPYKGAGPAFSWWKNHFGSVGSLLGAGEGPAPRRSRPRHRRAYPAMASASPPAQASHPPSPTPPHPPPPPPPSAVPPTPPHP